MIKFNTIALTALLAVSLNTFCQKNAWLVPAENIKRNNPQEINPRDIAAGKNVYSRTCVACHGVNADGKGLIQSSSLLTDTFQGQTDGAIFYKISTGMNKMPSFKSALKENEIWSVINYLRVLVNPAAVPAAKNIGLLVSAVDGLGTVTALVFEPSMIKQALNEIDVHFYIKRNFGLMRFGELSNYTGNDGKVSVSLPDNIVSDAHGNITIVVKIENNFLYNDTMQELVVKWGTALVTEDEKFNQRTLWGSRDKSPIWLLILANGIIAGVWLVIMYIIYNLFRIKKAGKIFMQKQ